MFKAKTNLGMLVECLVAITGVVDDGVVNVTKDGWDIRAVDPANVAMVSFELQRGAFDRFEFEPPAGKDQLKMGVDFGSLLEVLKSWEQEIAELELELGKNAENLYIKSDIFDYSFSELELSSLRREPNTPELNFHVQANVVAKQFINAIPPLRRVADDDYATIGVKNGEVYMQARGEQHKLKVILGKLSDTKEVSPRFNLDYLSQMCKGVQHTDTLTLSLGDDYPMQIGFDILYGKGKVSYLLAPRMSPDD